MIEHQSSCYWLQVAVLEADGSHNRQGDTVEHNPDNERPGHRLGRCEGCIEATGRLPHGRKGCRGRQKVVGGAMPEGIGRHNQVDYGGDILDSLEVCRRGKLYYELYNTGYRRSNK